MTEAQNFHITGTRPTNLLQHVIEDECYITGITPEDCIAEHGGAEFNLQELVVEFKKHCVDFDRMMVANQASKACHFAKLMIYNVGLESRKVKKGKPDMTWQFKFTIKKTNEQGVEVDDKHVVFVVTYKNEGAQFKPDFQPQRMTISLKQAGLLAQMVFKDMISFALNLPAPIILLTPLSGACFSKDDLMKLAEELGIEIRDLVIQINASTQSGGHYLADSDCSIAVCAAIAATRNLKEESLKKSIVIKVLKQYISKKKMPDAEKIEIISGYATGGVPVEFSYENLMKMTEKPMKEKEYKPRQINKLVKESAIVTRYR